MSNLDDEYWGRTNYQQSSGSDSNGSWIRFPKKGTEPQGLTDLRKLLGTNIMAGLQTFDTNSWNTAQGLTNQAQGLQSNLLGQLSGDNNPFTQNRNLVNEIADIARTGNIPSTLSNAMNASVNQNLQSSMGTMLNNLGKRGVLNSSVTNAGMNQLSQAAADAYNRNYMTAYQTVLSGLGQSLQGGQNNLTSLLSALGTIGNVPKQAYENVGAQLQTPYTWYKDWQTFYQNDDPYETVYSPNAPESDNCITGDTLVTLEDGREIPVAELKDDDKIRVWDFEKGELTSAPLTGFFKSNNKELDVVRIEFEDGSNVGVIVEHLFFDMTEGKFIAINSDSQEYVGHEFAKVTPEGKVVPVKVSRIFLDGKATETFAPQAEGYLNYLAGGVISGNDGQLGICNRFDFDGMKFDVEKRKADLKKYGRLDYEPFRGIVSKEFFDANHVDEFGVAFGKGLVSAEEFKAYLDKFAGYIFNEGSGE